jgi:NAD(P)-dependent dehydrogenase (short-subunit alcohol dehydrogenase family)
MQSKSVLTVSTISPPDHGVDRCMARIDVLVNNAGIQPVPSCVPIHELSDELWDRVISVNLTGIFRMTKLVLGSMLAQAAEQPGGPGIQGGGVIINVSSVQGLQSQAGVI